MDLGLGGKRVLITGGSRGIGFACAQTFLGEGADVVIAARDPERLAAAKKELAARAQGKVETSAVDMAAAGAAAKLAAAYPEIDILVNNAGAIPGGDLLAIDEGKWRAAWELKVFGYVNLAREMFGRMKQRKRGVIVNVIGLGGERHNFNYIAGAAGNASLMSFTHAMGAHSTDHGIRVVGVNPGLVATERMEFLMRTRQERARRRRALERTAGQNRSALRPARLGRGDRQCRRFPRLGPRRLYQRRRRARRRRHAPPRPLTAVKHWA